MDNPQLYDTDDDETPAKSCSMADSTSELDKFFGNNFSGELAMVEEILGQTGGKKTKKGGGPGMVATFMPFIIMASLGERLALLTVGVFYGLFIAGGDSSQVYLRRKVFNWGSTITKFLSYLVYRPELSNKTDAERKEMLREFIMNQVNIMVIQLSKAKLTTALKTQVKIYKQLTCNKAEIKRLLPDYQSKLDYAIKLRNLFNEVTYSAKTTRENALLETSLKSEDEVAVTTVEETVFNKIKNIYTEAIDKYISLNTIRVEMIKRRDNNGQIAATLAFHQGIFQPWQAFKTLWLIDEFNMVVGAIIAGLSSGGDKKKRGRKTGVVAQPKKHNM
jgi:hypothetical protein